MGLKPPRRLNRSVAVTWEYAWVGPSRHCNGNSLIRPMNRPLIVASVLEYAVADPPAWTWTASIHTCWPAVGDVAGVICRMCHFSVAVNVTVIRWNALVVLEAVPVPIPEIPTRTAGDPPEGTYTWAD